MCRRGTLEENPDLLVRVSTRIKGKCLRMLTPRVIIMAPRVCAVGMHKSAFTLFAAAEYLRRTFHTTPRTVHMHRAPISIEVHARLARVWRMLRRRGAQQCTLK